MPLSNMKNISSLQFLSSSNSSTPCDIYFKARQYKLPFQSSHISTTSIFELTHIDSWRPYKSTTYDDFRYFLTIVDDFSKATWTYLLKTKINAFSILKSFLAMVQTQFQTRVKTIRSYNALELGTSLLTSAYLSSMGILHQNTCVHTLQQNSVVGKEAQTPS